MNRRHWLMLSAIATLGVLAGCASGRPTIPRALRDEWMDMGTLQHRYTQVKGITMHALVSVEPAPPGAPAIVLVHGSGLSSRYMIPTATKLTSRFRVYVPDMPGFGRSDKPGIFDVSELADWLAAWMPAVGLERASFLGNSFGCQVIAALAVRHPQRVDKLVLQGPTTPPDERSVFWQFVRWRQNQRYNPDWMGDITDEAYEQAGWWRMIRSFCFQISDRIELRMPKIESPVLVVCGEEDPIANLEWCRTLARLAPNGELAAIPDVAHTLVFTAPERLATVTRRFILPGGIRIGPDLHGH